MRTYKQIINTAEKLGWSAEKSIDGKIVSIEFSQYSPAGEDFSFIAEGTSPDALVEDIEEYSSDFDKNEHVKMWAMSNSSGVPDIETLCEDARAIEDMLRDLCQHLY